MPAEKVNVVDAIDITEGSSNSGFVRGIGYLTESTANISCEVYPNVPREINPEISMSCYVKWDGHRPRPMVL